MRVLIVGLGNPILGDDGVGWAVANEVKRALAADQSNSELSSGDEISVEEIEVDCLAVGGLALMERMIETDHVILIDALTTGREPKGAIRTFPIEALPNHALGHLGSAHDTSLPAAMSLGRAMGANLPKQVTVVAIEAEISLDFSEVLSPPVAAAVPLAVQTVLELVHGAKVRAR